MLIGRDLQNCQALYVSPRQPTYLIDPATAMIRTKLGLVLSGQLDLSQLVKAPFHWRVSREEARQIEATLYPKNDAALSSVEDSSCLPLSTQIQLRKLLTLRLSDHIASWQECYGK